MAYKDEYEVARLFTNGEFKKQLQETFEGDYRLYFNLAPPLLSRPDKKTGVAKKMRFGRWIYPAFTLLARLKVLRGSPFDIFSYTAERRQERLLIHRYEHTVDQLLEHLTPDNVEFACQIASLPDQIRGYGHVKLHSIKTVSAKWDAMLDNYTRGETSFTRSNPVKLVEPAEVTA